MESLIYLLYIVSKNKWMWRHTRRWDSVVGIATNFGLDRSGLESRWEREIFSSPCRPHRLCGQHSLVFRGIGILSQRQFRRDVKLATDLCLVLRLRMSDTILLYAFVAWTGTALLFMWRHKYFGYLTTRCRVVTSVVMINNRLYVLCIWLSSKWERGH
jgi:hypothetical protein